MSEISQHVAFCFTFGALGAALVEAVHWYDRRESLEENDYERLFRDRRYWLICGVFVVLAGLGCVAWYWGMQASGRDCVVFGIALPSVVKQILAARAKSRDETLGSGSEESARPATTWDLYLK